MDETRSDHAGIVAGFWSRLLALFIDSLILGAIGSVLGGVFFDQLAQLGDPGRLIGLVFFLGYFGFQESSIGGGQTIGKRICRIRVVGKDGHCISLGRSLARTLVWAVPYSLNNLNIPAADANTWYVSLLGVYVLTFLFALVYLYVFNRRTRQSVHDLITETYVVTAETSAISGLLPVWKGHYVVIGIWLGLLLGLGALIKVSGFGGSFLSGLVTLQNKVYEIPDVRGVGLNEGKTFTSNGTSSGISVVVTFIHKIPDVEKAQREVAAALLSDPTDVGHPDFIRISVGRAYNIGIASGDYYSSDIHNLDDWKSKLPVH